MIPAIGLELSSLLFQSLEVFDTSFQMLGLLFINAGFRSHEIKSLVSNSKSLLLSTHAAMQVNFIHSTLKILHNPELRIFLEASGTSSLDLI